MIQDDLEQATPRTRPGGLTALAVINFVLAGFGFIGLMMNLVLISGSEDTIRSSMGVLNWDFSAFRSFLTIVVLWGFISCSMILIAGVGYLKMKKNMGRYLGTTWAISLVIMNIITTIYATSKFPGFPAMGFSFIIGLIYPIITLFLLNVTFKDDLVK